MVNSEIHQEESLDKNFVPHKANLSCLMESQELDHIVLRLHSKFPKMNFPLHITLHSAFFVMNGVVSNRFTFND